MSEEGLKRTPLHERHVALGAKIVPFAGYDMPVSYPRGMTHEHLAVRSQCGVFDVSHMGEFMVTGPDAVAFADFVTSNDVRRLSPGQVQYSTILTEHGTIVDDCLVYRLESSIMLVVNASNRAKDIAHIARFQGGFDCAIEDVSDTIALLAIQGPEAARVLRTLTAAPLDEILYYHFTHADVAGAPVLLSRTGYTGEDGFELYFDAGRAVAVWDALVANPDVTPAGLGARDSLRLEAGLALYGNDIDETIAPIEANLSWVAKLDKPRFVGREALVAMKAAGVTRRLAGFRLVDRAIPRHGYGVLSGDAVIDCVRSGIMSPTLGFGIGTTYVPKAMPNGATIAIDIRGRRVPATVTALPFYRTSHPAPAKTKSPPL